MKNIILFTACLLSTILAKENTVLIKVDGMVCNYSCTGKVSSIVQNINGVKECSVDFEKGIATVVYDDKKLEEKDIVEGLINNTQYKASLLDNKKTSPILRKIWIPYSIFKTSSPTFVGFFVTTMIVNY